MVRIFTTLVLLSLPLAARADKNDEGKHYTGGHIGVGLIGGADILSDSAFDAQVGYMVGAYARIASVLHVVDGQLEYHLAGHQFTHLGAPIALKKHSLSASMNLHPLFLRILNNNWLWYTLAGIYVQAGMGVDVMTQSSRELDLDRHDTAFVMHIGAGVDMPLGDPGNGGGFWLGFAWRWKFAFLDAQYGGGEDFDSHVFLMSIAYRSTNISFMRVERPPELKWR